MTTVAEFKTTTSSAIYHAKLPEKVSLYKTIRRAILEAPKQAKAVNGRRQDNTPFSTPDHQNNKFGKCGYHLNERRI